VWPFRRRAAGGRPPANQAADPPGAVASGEVRQAAVPGADPDGSGPNTGPGPVFVWLTAPPIQRALAASPPLTVNTRPSRDVASFRQPQFISTHLGHAIDPGGPSGQLRTAVAARAPRLAGGTDSSFDLAPPDEPYDGIPTASSNDDLPIQASDQGSPSGAATEPGSRSLLPAPARKAAPVQRASAAAAPVRSADAARRDAPRNSPRPTPSAAARTSGPSTSPRRRRRCDGSPRRHWTTRAGRHLSSGRRRRTIRSRCCGRPLTRHRPPRPSRRHPLRPSRRHPLCPSSEPGRSPRRWRRSRRERGNQPELPTLRMPRHRRGRPRRMVTSSRRTPPPGRWGCRRRLPRRRSPPQPTLTDARNGCNRAHSGSVHR
jgi:hypothetical protein